MILDGDSLSNCDDQCTKNVDDIKNLAILWILCSVKECL